jgi:hypothetical protein
MKDLILSPNKWTYDLWQDILIPKLVSVGWTDLGTQTVSVNLYGTVYNETFRGVKNSLGQVFCLENGAYGLFTIIPSTKNTPGNFIPDLTQLNWRVVGLKTPKANEGGAENLVFDNNFVFYYSDKSFILIDVSNIKTGWYNTYFKGTRYNPVLMFLSISPNVFLIAGANLLWPSAYFRNDIIVVKDGVYIYNEDPTRNDAINVLNIDSNLIKAGFTPPYHWVPNSGYINAYFPKIFINNELIDQDYIISFIGTYDIPHNTNIGNFDIFYLHKPYPNYIYYYNNYIGVNKNKF